MLTQPWSKKFGGIR